MQCTSRQLSGAARLTRWLCYVANASATFLHVLCMRCCPRALCASMYSFSMHGGCSGTAVSLLLLPLVCGGRHAAAAIAAAPTASAPLPLRSVSQEGHAARTATASPAAAHPLLMLMSPSVYALAAYRMIVSNAMMGLSSTNCSVPCLQRRKKKPSTCMVGRQHVMCDNDGCTSFPSALTTTAPGPPTYASSSELKL